MKTKTSGIDWKKCNGLVPTIVQESKSGKVLMLAYSNKKSLEKALSTGQGYYWSRSRAKLWQKGETSGNKQELVKAQTDCDGDSLLFKVKQKGPVCHTGKKTCFFREVEK